MTDDYLLQEFHEAGIWLPDELEVIRRQQENQRNWARQMDMMIGAQSMSLQAQQFALGQQRGSSHPTDLLGGGLRGILGGF